MLSKHDRPEAALTELSDQLVLVEQLSEALTFSDLRVTFFEVSF